MPYQILFIRTINGSSKIKSIFNITPFQTCHYVKHCKVLAITRFLTKHIYISPNCYLSIFKCLWELKTKVKIPHENFHNLGGQDSFLGPQVRIVDDNIHFQYIVLRIKNILM